MTIACEKHRKVPVIGIELCAGCEMEWLREELELLRKDALRYRWLRDDPSSGAQLRAMKTGDLVGRECDESIDSSMSE